MMDNNNKLRPQEYLYDPPPESELVPFTIDPHYMKLRSRGPNLMQVYDPAPWVLKRNFFSRLLHRCLDAWSPARRRNRDRKLMPHPKPMVDLWWWIYGRFKGKAWREKPWTVEMDFSVGHDTHLFQREDVAKMYPDWQLEILRMLTAPNWAIEDPDDAPPIDERPQESPRDLREDEQLREINGTRPRQYRLVDYGRAIECLTCGYASYNANDIRERYCGHCHHFHDEAGYPGRQREIMSVIDRDGSPPLQTMIE